jgi:tetratricopeptide (TPR) repeat protein
MSKMQDLPIDTRKKLIDEMYNIANSSTLSLNEKVQRITSFSRQYPNSYHPHFFLSILHENGKDFKKAIEHYNQAEKLLNDDLLTAQIARHLAPSDAINIVINKLKADRALIYNYIGFCYDKLGNKEQAFSFYNQSLADNLNFAEALSNRAKQHGVQGNYKAALVDAYQAIYHQPGHARAWLWCSAAHAMLGEYSQASLALRKAKELATTNQELPELAAKLEKNIAAGQEKSKEQELPAQQPPSSSSSSSSSSQSVAPQSVAPKSTTLARSDDDPMIASFKEGEASKENLDALLKAIQVKQEHMQESEQEQPTSSPSSTTKAQAGSFTEQESRKRNRSEQSPTPATEQEQPKGPGKKSKSQAEKVISDRVTRSNGKGKGLS